MASSRRPNAFGTVIAGRCSPSVGFSESLRSTDQSRSPSFLVTAEWNTLPASERARCAVSVVPRASIGSRAGKRISEQIAESEQSEIVVYALGVNDEPGCLRIGREELCDDRLHLGSRLAVDG
jgi:hypothetical protein